MKWYIVYFDLVNDFMDQSKSTHGTHIEVSVTVLSTSVSDNLTAALPLLLCTSSFGHLYRSRTKKDSRDVLEVEISAKK